MPPIRPDRRPPRSARRVPAILAALAVAASLTVPAVPGTPASASGGCAAGDVRVYMVSNGWSPEDAEIKAALETIGATSTGLCITAGVGHHSLAGVASTVTRANFDVIYLQMYWDLYDDLDDGREFTSADAQVLADFVQAGGGLVVSEWTLWSVRYREGSGWSTLSALLPAVYETSTGQDTTARFHRWNRDADTYLDRDIPEDFVFDPGADDWFGQLGFLLPKEGASVPYLMTVTNLGGTPPTARAFDQATGDSGVWGVSERVWAGLTSWELLRAGGDGTARVAAFGTVNTADEIARPSSGKYSADLRRLVANTLLWSSGLGDPIAPLTVGPAAPGTPAAPSVVAGEEQVTVTVVEPSSGDAPTSWTVTAAPGGATCTVAVASGSCTVTALDPALSYTFTATATNDGGTSAASPQSLAVTPLAVTPPAPTDPDPGAGPEARSVSTAGTEWTARPDAPQQSWNAVAYGGGVWVAVADDGTRRVMRSVDGGVTWSSDGITGADTFAGDNARAWRSLAYGADPDGEGGVWIAVGGSPGPAALRSTDGGLTWTEHALPISRTWSSVAHADGTWIAVAPNSNDRLIRSIDGGLTWTEHTLPRSSEWWSVAGDGDGTWVAVADRTIRNVARSTDDGVTWTEVTGGPMADHRWRAVTFAPDPDVPGEGAWVATAVAGTTRVMRSTDGGASWAAVTVTGSDLATWGSVGYGDGVLVAVSGDGPLGDEVLLRTMRSTDAGATWQVNPAAAFNQWTSVAFGAGSWVAVSRGGSSLRVMTSGASVTSTDPDDDDDDDDDDLDGAGGGGGGDGSTGSTDSSANGSGSTGSDDDATGPAPTWIAGADGRAPSLPQGAALARLPDGTEVPLTLVWDGDARVRLVADGTGGATGGADGSVAGAPAADTPGSIEVILSGAVRRDASGAVVVDPDGEVSVELRGPVAAGTLDVWMFSTPRHLATVTVNGVAVQTFVLPLGAPADGAGPVAAGAHTLQLVVPTGHGMQAVDVSLTVGPVAGTGAVSGPVSDAVSGEVSDAVSGPVPTGVPAGEGAGQAGSAGLALVLLLGAGVASLAHIDRRRRAVEGGRAAGR